MADTVLATTIAHEIQLIRYSKTLGKDAGVYVDNIMKALREELLSTDKVTTKKQRDELIKFINELFASELGDWNSELESDLTRLIKEEAKFYQASLASLIGEKVARPTLESITRAAYNTEMVLNGQAYTVNERIKQYDVNSVDKVKRIVTGGWRDGLTTHEMAQQITGTQNSSVKNQMKRGAYILSKDLTSHVSSVAKTKVGMENQDVVIGERHISTLDSRTSPACFPGEVLAESCGEPLALARAEYAGELVTIYLSSGDKLKATSNHPIFTGRGWTLANKINPSNEIVYRVRGGGLAISGVPNVNVESKLSNIFDSLLKGSVSNVVEKRASTADLYGDSKLDDAKVDILTPNGKLWGDSVSKTGEPIEKFLLTIREFSGLFSVFGELDLCCLGSFISIKPSKVAFCVRKSFVESAFFNTNSFHDVFGSNSIIKEIHSFSFFGESFICDESPFSWLHNSVLLEEICNRGNSYAILPSDFACTHTGGVFCENVVGVRVELTDYCHVYTFETSTGSFIANGCLVKNCQRLGSLDNGGKKYIYSQVGYNFTRPPIHFNCRSTHSFLLAPEYEEPEEPRTRPSVVDGRAKRVDSETSWMELAKNNPNLARESLGVERAKVLDAMSADEFTKIAYNRLDQLITIDELVKKSKVAAKSLGRD